TQQQQHPGDCTEQVEVVTGAVWQAPSHTGKDVEPFRYVREHHHGEANGTVEKKTACHPSLNRMRADKPRLTTCCCFRQGRPLPRPIRKPCDEARRTTVDRNPLSDEVLPPPSA